MTSLPLTLPPELVQQWRAAASNVPASLSTDPGGRRDYIDFIATKAARWGADTELEACCLWMERNFDDWDNRFSDELRAARRPKPPSLKEQALADLDTLVGRGRSSDTIRCALEQLDD
jgi:hypothetical protein